MSVEPQVESVTDKFFFDSEQLHALADDATVRMGLGWFKENRVIAVSLYQDDELQAIVEDPVHHDNLQCEIHFGANHTLHMRCDCGVDGERACGHVIAALCAHAARDADSTLRLSAAEHAIDLRIQRGRSEVNDEPLNNTLWFGDWNAVSITTDSHFPHSYRVNIRSLKQRSNYCNCMDFATN